MDIRNKGTGLDGSSLLAQDEPAPFERVNAAGKAPLLVVCDHASCRVPRALDGLGVPAEELRRHIGWDIGAADVARQLAHLLDAPAVLAAYSRLVIDTNRYPNDPELIREVSDGTVLPANIGLDARQRAQRVSSIYDAYHDAVDRQLQEIRRSHATPAVIAIHSFSAALGSDHRPWHVGFLWDEDGRLAVPLMQALGAGADIVVGDNEPYSGAHAADFTLDHHAEEVGLPHVSIEIRNDLIDSRDGAFAWAEQLGAALARVLGIRFGHETR